MSEVETTPIEDLIDAAYQKNYTAATEIFNDAIGQKMQDALDQQKLALADQIFNGVDPVDPELDDYDTDNELEDPDEDADLSDEEIDEIDYDEDDLED